jgi:hypothetical protein
MHLPTSLKKENLKKTKKKPSTTLPLLEISMSANPGSSMGLS